MHSSNFTAAFLLLISSLVSSVPPSSEHRRLHRRAPDPPTFITVTVTAPPTTCATDAQHPFVAVPFSPAQAESPPATAARGTNGGPGTSSFNGIANPPPAGSSGDSPAAGPGGPVAGAPFSPGPAPSGSGSISSPQINGFTNSGVAPGQITYGGSGSRGNADPPSNANVANPTAAATVPGQPIVTLLPGLHPDHNGDDIEHLRPTNNKTLFYAEHNLGSSAGTMSQFATLAFNSSFQVVALEHSSYIDYSVGADGRITVTFADSTGFDFAKKTWTPVASNLLFVVSQDPSGNLAEERKYYAVSLLTFDSAGMKAVASSKAITIQDMAHIVEVNWGNYVPIDVGVHDGSHSSSASPTAGSSTTTNVFDQPGAVTRSSSVSSSGSSSSSSLSSGTDAGFTTSGSTLTSSSSGSTSSGSTLTSSPSGSTSSGTSTAAISSSSTSTVLVDDPSCSGTSGMVDGFKAAACGSSFDTALDDANGYLTADQASLLADPTASTTRFRSVKRGLLGKLTKTVTKALKVVKIVIPPKIQAKLNVILKPLAKALKVVSAVAKLLSPTPSFDKTFSLSLAPPLQKKSPFAGTKKVFPLFHDSYSAGKKNTTGTFKASIDVYCVDCGVYGQLKMHGSAKFDLSTFSLSDGKIDLSGKLHAGVGLGLDAKASYEKQFKKEIASAGLPGLSIPKILIIGPVLKLEAQMDLKLAAEAQLMAGIYYKIDDFKATLSLSSSQASKAPTFHPYWDKVFFAKGQVTASAVFSLPVTFGVGLDMPIIKKSKTISITDKPGIKLETKALLTTDGTGLKGSKTDPCANGLSWAIYVINTVSLNFFDLAKVNISDWQSKLDGACYHIPGLPTFPVSTKKSSQPSSKSLSRTSSTITTSTVVTTTPSTSTTTTSPSTTLSTASSTTTTSPPKETATECWTQTPFDDSTAKSFATCSVPRGQWALTAQTPDATHCQNVCSTITGCNYVLLKLNQEGSYPYVCWLYASAPATPSVNSCTPDNYNAPAQLYSKCPAPTSTSSSATTSAACATYSNMYPATTSGCGLSYQPAHATYREVSNDPSIGQGQCQALCDKDSLCNYYWYALQQYGSTPGRGECITDTQAFNSQFLQPGYCGRPDFPYEAIMKRINVDCPATVPAPPMMKRQAVSTTATDQSSTTSTETAASTITDAAGSSVDGSSVASDGGQTFTGDGKSTPLSADALAGIGVDTSPADLAAFGAMDDFADAPPVSAADLADDQDLNSLGPADATPFNDSQFSEFTPTGGTIDTSGTSNGTTTTDGGNSTAPTTATASSNATSTDLPADDFDSSSASYFTISDPSGTLLLSISDKNNLILTPASSYNNPSTVPQYIGDGTGNIYASVSQQTFHYHPLSLARYGASRLRAADDSRIPSDAALIAFAPIDTGDSADAGVKALLPVDLVSGTAHLTAWCEYANGEGQEGHLFIVDSDEGVSELVSESVQRVVTGGTVERCVVVGLVQQVKGVGSSSAATGSASVGTATSALPTLTAKARIR